MPTSAEYTPTLELVCVSCDREFPDEALDDDGYCADCAFAADIRKAETLLDATRDR